MFLVPRERLAGGVGRGVGPAWLLRKDFVVAGTRALEFDGLCAAGRTAVMGNSFQHDKANAETGTSRVAVLS